MLNHQSSVLTLETTPLKLIRIYLSVKSALPTHQFASSNALSKYYLPFQAVGDTKSRVKGWIFDQFLNIIVVVFYLFLLFCFWFLCELYHLKWLRTTLFDSLIYISSGKKWVHFAIKSLKDLHCSMSAMTAIFHIDLLDTWSLRILGRSGVNLLQGRQAIMA